MHLHYLLTLRQAFSLPVFLSLSPLQELHLREEKEKPCSKVTNTSQQAEGYPDQSHYLFHLPSHSYQEQDQTSLLKTTLETG